MLHWQFKHFNELSTIELYDILALRVRVFVVEQNCPYQEVDEIDPKSFHLILKDQDNNTVGTMRIFLSAETSERIIFGRIVLAKSHRGIGLADEMLERAIAFASATYGKKAIKLSAQTAVTALYERNGFQSTGRNYLEDGIPHTEMIRTFDV